MKKIYIGGSLFTDKQIKQRLEEERLLKDKFMDISVYNPISNDDINDKTKDPTPKDIFLQDTKKVIESDTIIADLDDVDTGLAMELGVAYGVNFVKELIEKCLESNVPESSLRDVLDSIPTKKIFATCSDIRQDSTNENGIYKSWGHNQYVVGGIQEMGNIYRHFEDVLEALNSEKQKR